MSFFKYCQIFSKYQPLYRKFVIKPTICCVPKRPFASIPNDPHPWLHLNENIAEALDCGLPVVALESTIITHGMPRPTNFETALQVEQVVRDNGAIPATVAIIDGRLCVGLTTSQLELLAQATNGVKKVSRRDLMMMLGSKGSLGGTTVSATMLAAHWAGISVFATGGVGGVHRGGEYSMDVSSDLTELGRTPVCVVSAGVKSLLDVKRSLEYLETRGVCVVSMGVDEFPAFFTRNSGVPSPARVNNAAEVSRLIRVMLRSKLQSGVLVAVPIPKKFEALGERIENAIQQSIADATQKGITGASLTPFILERINELTQGDSLVANVQLIKNNAAVAAQIAVEHSKLEPPLVTPSGGPKAQQLDLSFVPYETKGVDTFPEKYIVVVGGSGVDQVCRLVSPSVQKVDELQPLSYVGSIAQSCGGVARNVVESLSRMGGVNGQSARFLTAIGDDLGGSFLRSNSSVIDWSHARVIPKESGFHTASYNVTLNTKGELLFGVGDMAIHKTIDSGYIEGKFVDENWFGASDQKNNSNCALVCTDGNITLDSLTTIIRLTQKFDIPLWYEPTDVRKATCILDAIRLYQAQCKKRKPAISDCVSYISPNLSEYLQLYQALLGDSLPIPDSPHTNLNGFLTCLYDSVRDMQQFIPHWFIKLGPHGLMTVTPECCHWFGSPVSDDAEIVSVSGAGDSLVGCLLFLRFVCGLDWSVSSAGGLKAAQLSIKGSATVSDRLKISDFHPNLIDKFRCELDYKQFH